MSGSNFLVATEKMVMQLAKVYVVNVYGLDVYIKQEPYIYENGEVFWIVKGRMKKLIPGGVFEIKISKKNGEVLHLSHTR